MRSSKLHGNDLSNLKIIIIQSRGYKVVGVLSQYHITDTY
jgi:hypothetical protein